MKLSTKSLPKFIRGAIDYEEKNGYLHFYRFTKDQIATVYSKTEFCGLRTEETASLKFVCKTDATKFEVEYKLDFIGSKDSIDCFADGKLCQIVPVSTLAEQGKRGKVELTFPAGEKEVEILFPSDATTMLKSVSANGYIRKAKDKKTKILWIGDSITHGYGSFRSGEVYVEVATRILNCDTVNQGIGGYVHDGDIITKIDGYTPDKIVVAYGTNHYKAENFEVEVTKFYERLTALYPAVPVVAITPLWRKESEENLNKLKLAGEIIQKVTAKYPNIKVINGFDLVPNLDEYFMDGLHPNALGMRVYGEELVRKFKAIKF